MIKNIKKGPITTGLGALLILAAIFYILYPLIKSEAYEASATVLTILLSFGAILLVSPDDIIPFIKSKK